MLLKDANREFEKLSTETGERRKSRNRRRSDIEKLLVENEILRAKVKDDEVSLFLSSHTVVKISLRTTDEGPLQFGWNSLDTMKTDDDYKL